MSDEVVLYEESENVGVVTLNRPEAMNSLTYQSYLELEDRVRECSARVLVITGQGRAFCAGDDVKHILGSSQPAPGLLSERLSSPRTLAIFGWSRGEPGSWRSR